LSKNSPKLGQPVILSNRAIELNLSGQMGSAYTVEASTNLSNWFLISGGIATNGLLTIRHDAAIIRRSSTEAKGRTLRCRP
jgi:hypothetical protein